VIDKRYFQGLPSPAAAGLIAGLVWAMESYDVARADIPLLAWALTLFAGITMVSSVRFYSGKDINLRKSVPFRIVVMIALSVVALMQVANNLPEVLFTVFASYAASGYVMWAWERLRRKKPIPPAGQ
jgi:CDP-diacylglycerol--serine O-phosphatidyltransferase